MRYILAKSAGFCFGVARAVKTAETALEKGSCICFGELIHNDDVIQDLETRGMRTVDDCGDIPDGSRVIIRSHGASEAVYKTLEGKNCEITDATCPKVKKIHNIVSEASAAGKTVIIIGDEGHPEVSAICGWCENPLVFGSGAVLEKYIREQDENGGFEREFLGKGLVVVFQTTQTREIFNNAAKIIKKGCTNAEIFDTICEATVSRQREAELLAAQTDAMVVIGAKNSGNSTRLYELCKSKLPNTQFIANAAELDKSLLRGRRVTGITAGASTPARIIKEVIHKMNDEIKVEEQTEQITEKTFDELLEDSIKTVYNGEAVSGIVAAITPTEVSVDLGTKHSGYIPVSEFTDDSGKKIEDIISVGDTIEAIAVRVNDVEGTVMLSKKRLDAVKSWSDVEQAQKNGTTVEGTVTEENKGGIVVNVNGLRVFVPASQSGLAKDEPMSKLLKQKVRLRITEVNRARRRLVGSIRSVAASEKRERLTELWGNIEVGKKYTGTVKSLTSYGAFVDIGGVDGMVHISELSWKKIRHPSEAVSAGDTIEVYVVSFDKDARKISLGYKDPNADPWVEFRAKYNVGDTLEVTIVKLMSFGAFAEVLPGVDGLIHISQLSENRIQKADEAVKPGDRVTVKITHIDEARHKISLSVRAVSEPDPADKAGGETASAEGDALVYEISPNGDATGNIPENEEE